MEAITQSAALSPLAGRERARFFMAGRFAGLECMTATFHTHCYALHTHDTYSIGAILDGCETWHARGRQHYAGAGNLVFVNPQDAHDGAPHGGGYAYRMTYPTVAMITEIAAEIAGRTAVGTPSFAEAAVHDPEGVALFTAAHRALEDDNDPLAAEELLHRAYARCLARNGRVEIAAVGREHGPVARVKALLSDHHADDLTLTALAATAGLSRHHLIRAFRRETGFTPHAYLVNCRVDAAKTRLRRGESPADVAVMTGFCDQAHLTRAFKARIGVTPGVYRAAALA
jgi:AraC-like DNA-binding protein